MSKIKKWLSTSMCQDKFSYYFSIYIEKYISLVVITKTILINFLCLIASYKTLSNYVYYYNVVINNKVIMFIINISNTYLNLSSKILIYI